MLDSGMMAEIYNYTAEHTQYSFNIAQADMTPIGSTYYLWVLPLLHTRGLRLANIPGCPESGVYTFYSRWCIDIYHPKCLQRSLPLPHEILSVSHLVHETWDT